MNSFNYSAIDTAYRCNKLYQYIYVDKLKTNEPESGDILFGTGIHAAIQACLEGGNGVETFSIYWNSIKSSNVSYGRYSWDALSSQAITLIARFERLHAKKFKIFEMETRLYGSLPNGIKIEGTPDFLGDFEGVPSIVDFKTSGNRYPKEKIECSDQLMLYSALASQARDYTAHQVVYCVLIKATTPDIQIIKAPLLQSELAKRISNIQDICNELKSKQVFTQNFSQCMAFGRRCAFYDKCHKEAGGE